MSELEGSIDIWQIYERQTLVYTEEWRPCPGPGSFWLSHWMLRFTSNIIPVLFVVQQGFL
jgi:hypothetical protein